MTIVLALNVNQMKIAIAKLESVNVASENRVKINGGHLPAFSHKNQIHIHANVVLQRQNVLNHQKDVMRPKVHVFRVRFI